MDFVTFLQPKVDGACGAPGIWAHRYFMSAWNGSPYKTKSPRRGAGGVILPGQFILVDDYTMVTFVLRADREAPLTFVWRDNKSREYRSAIDIKFAT